MAQNQKQGGSTPAKVQNPTLRKTKHPILLRLPDSSGLSVTSPLSLTSSGYASLTMGLCTAFRPTHGLFYSLIIRFYKFSPDWSISQLLILVFPILWSALVLFVLLVLGTMLAASKKITKRWVLLLHPWGLLLLYLDVFIWLSALVWFHLYLNQFSELSLKIFTRNHYALEFFLVMYVECCLMCPLYYVYATYFIAAELTVIEKFF